MHLQPYVFFEEADVAVWENGKPEAILDPGVVEIWRLHFPSCIHRLPELYEILNPEEKSKSALFYHETDKYKFIIGKAMLRMLLGDYLNKNPETLDFTLGVNMKPVLKMDNDISMHFNLSHSGEYILIAVSDSPVGIDIERYETDLNINEVIEIAFSAKEIRYLKRQTNPDKTFFKLWTRKEALLKATSKGLNDDIRSVPCLDGKHAVSAALINNSQHWRVSNFVVDDQHTGSIAYLKSSRELRFRQFISQTADAFC